MLFNSINFLFFFPIVVLIYLLIPRKLRYLWLLIASFYFYMCWNAKYALLLLISIITTWGAGQAMKRKKNDARKKIILVLCISINLGILFLFKYLDFGIHVLNQVFDKVGLQIIHKQFDVLLPVGISFYTFQALGYIIDVYKEKVTPEKNILRYALFVSFFPQLVAGPIERTKNLLKQVREIEEKQVWNYENISNGLILMIWGLYVKMVISDRVAILVNNVFNSFYMYGTIELVLAAVGFALQIYCDFMGYSTIAIGAAKVMGFSLMENFDTPYFSKTIGEFWKRWHISLSTWFRDYVYIPLGGNRKGTIRRYVNLMITFSISGLWHGASWNFVAWGMFHGILQIIEQSTASIRKIICEKFEVKTECFSYKLGQVIMTFLLVDIGWIFFRAKSLTQAKDYIVRIFTKWNPWAIFDGTICKLGLEANELNILVVASCILFCVSLIKYKKKQSLDVFLNQQCMWFKWGVLFILISSVMVYGIYGIKFDSSQFIYFQF